MSVSGTRWQRLLAIIIVLVMVMTSVNFQSALAESKTAENNSALDANLQQQMGQCFGLDAQPATNIYTGKMNFVGIGASKPLMQAEQNLISASPDKAARGYLSECGSFFGVSDQAKDLSVLSQKKIPDGRSVVRFQQTYQGVPVFGGQLLVQLTSTNAVILVNGDILPIAKLNMQPKVDASSAQQTAMQMVADKYQVAVDSLQSSAPLLSIYSPSLFQEKAAAPALVWRMEVTPRELAPIRELVLLDAHSGTVALSINQLDTLKNRKTYTAGNTTNQQGTLICDESDPTCSAGVTAGDTDAVKAHLYAGDTYDFYFKYHKRDSINNAGMSLISTVHYDTGYCNAFWDGLQMTYGDGCTHSIVTDDVVAHELTHGVTEYESGLVYFQQQGAINESFSDIWGEFVDQVNKHGIDTAAVKWVMGEEVQTGGFRNMKDPTLFGDPDRMGSPNYYNGTADNGGVHWNSGVGNKAAYLITDGATFNGATITGIGITKAAAIYYEAQTNILVPTSNYRSLRNALNTACNTLIGGTQAITAANCLQVNNATLATEMDLVPLPAPAPANNNISTPVIMTVNKVYSNTQDIINATTALSDPGFPDPDYAGYQGSNTVWYKFTPLANGYFTANTIGSNFDSLLSLWKGAPGSLTNVAYNDDINSNQGNYQSAIRAFVTSGTVYYIEVAGFYGAAQNLELNTTFRPIITSEYRKSDGARDGWVLESTESSGVGGSINATLPTFNLGDETRDRQYRAILSFNTALPAGAKITKATLKIKRPATGYLVGNNNPFTWGLGLKANVCKGMFGTSTLLQVDDFKYNNTTNCASQVGTFGTTPDADWYSAPISIVGIAKINTVGLTQFRLAFVKYDNDDGAADYLKFYSGNAGTSSPRLVLEYYYP